MADRAQRLKKLLDVQRKMTALHERRHASHLADALRADEEAQELAARFDAEDGMGALFPELYHRRIAGAVARRDDSRLKAEQESGRVLAAKVRTGRVEEAYKDAARHAERQADEKSRLEIIERRFGTSK